MIGKTFAGSQLPIVWVLTVIFSKHLLLLCLHKVPKYYVRGDVMHYGKYGLLFFASTSVSVLFVLR